MYEIGSIILISNVIFKNKIIRNKLVKRYEIDHAHKRPAIIIAEDENYTYFLKIISRNIKKGIIKYAQYPVFNPNEKHYIKGYISLDSIYKRPVCYRDEIESISDEDLLKLLQKFCYFQENYLMDEEYECIKKLIYEKIEELSKVKQKLLINKN